MRYSDMKCILGVLILQIIPVLWIGTAYASSGIFGATDWDASQSVLITTVPGGIPYTAQSELGAPPIGKGGNALGNSVATWHDTATGVSWLVAGAHYESAGRGAAYVFSRSSPDAPWHQDAHLTASDGISDDYFGEAVAIEGTTIVIGAPDHDHGVAYTFDRDANGKWNQQNELSVSGMNLFGQRLVMSSGVLAVGAPYSDSGHVFVYMRFGTGWTAVGSLTPPDAPAHAYFGSSLSLDNQRLLIGAPGDSSIAMNRGSAYLFAYDIATTSWQFRQKLVSFDGDTNSQVGEAVALQGNNALLGAPGRDSYRGAVVNFLFNAPTGTWNQQPTLQAADGMENDRFGASLTLAGSILAIGAPVHAKYAGGVYVFTGSASSWTPVTTLADSAGNLGASMASADGDIISGAPSTHIDYDSRGAIDVFSKSSGLWQEKSRICASADALEHFGFSVAISGDTVIVKAPAEKDAIGNDGAVNVYVRDSDKSWSWQAELSGIGINGYRVLALDGDTALIGVLDQDFGSHFYQGAAYIFVRTRTSSGVAWTQQAELADLSGDDDDGMGTSVALVGDTAIIGAPGANNGSGIAYVYLRTGTTWSLQAKLAPAEAKDSDAMGVSVAIYGNTVLLGAPGTSNNTGVAYLFQRTGSSWSEKKIIVAADAATGDYFGASVALNGRGAFVSASGKSIGTNTEQGRVYAFSGSTWSTQSQIDSPSPMKNGMFGDSLAIDGDRLAIGEPGSNSAYLFARKGGLWSLQSTMLGDMNSSFGLSTGISKGTVIVGAPYAGNYSGGRAYLFQDDRIFADGFD